MGRLTQAEFSDKRFEPSNPLITEINNGKFDKDVVRDLFDVLVKHALSYEVAPFAPLQLEQKAK